MKLILFIILFQFSVAQAGKIRPCSETISDENSFDTKVINISSLGDDKDNGGDAIILVDGNGLVLRELNGEDYEVFRGEDVFKIAPEFEILLKKIEKIHPKFARKLRFTTKQTRFYLLKRMLPEMKMEDISYERPDGETIQIAIQRDGKFVFISEKSFYLLKDREFLILHEVLHIIVARWKKSSKQLNHFKVRKLTSYIYRNIDKNLSKKDLVKFFRTFEIVLFKKGLEWAYDNN